MLNFMELYMELMDDKEANRVLDILDEPVPGFAVTANPSYPATEGVMCPRVDGVFVRQFSVFFDDPNEFRSHLIAY